MNIQVDSQTLATFMSCRRKYYYKYERHLIPIQGVSKSIQKGSLAHLGLHKYWDVRIKTGDYQQAVSEAIELVKTKVVEYNNLDSEASLDVLSNLVEFFKFQQTSQNANFIPLFAEQHFRFLAITIEDYLPDKEPLNIYLTGRIDLGLKTPQVPLIPIDNKTEAERWFYSQMSTQFKIYCLACKVNVLGVQRFGFQKSLKVEEKFKIELIPFDWDILEEFRTITLPYYVKEMIKADKEGYYPLNHASCIHGHFACEFSDKYNGGICNVSREVREQKLERYFSIGEPWDPENV